jgi:hypothetical protein
MKLPESKSDSLAPKHHDLLAISMNAGCPGGISINPAKGLALQSNNPPFSYLVHSLNFAIDFDRKK